MVVTKLANNENLIVLSNFDSGSFIGYSLSVTKEGFYGTERTLDKVLTQEQIKALESVLSVMVHSYIKENNK